MSIKLQESEDFSEILRYSAFYLGSPPTDAESRAISLWLADNPKSAALATDTDLEALHGFLRELRPVPVPSMSVTAMAAAKAKITGLLQGLSDILGRSEVAPDPNATAERSKNGNGDQ